MPCQLLTSVHGAALVLCAYGIRVAKGKTNWWFVKVVFETQSSLPLMIIYGTKMQHQTGNEKYKFINSWN